MLTGLECILSLLIKQITRCYIMSIIYYKTKLVIQEIASMFDNIFIFRFVYDKKRMTFLNNRLECTI